MFDHFLLLLSISSVELFIVFFKSVGIAIELKPALNDFSANVKAALALIFLLPFKCEVDWKLYSDYIVSGSFLSS